MKVKVCSECLRAGCFNGVFYCEDHKTAGTVDLPFWALVRLDQESPDNWSPIPVIDIEEPPE